VQRAILIAAFAVIALVHLTSIPRTIWEYDESLFCMAVESYDPLRHFPPPPGYPIYIGVAQLVAPLAGHVPFRALVALSAFTALAGFVLLAVAFRAITGSMRAGAAGAFLFYASPAMLLHATLPQSDSGALALLALSIWLCARCLREPVETRWIVLAALACAVTVGWRLQFAIAVVPLLLTTLLLLRSWRQRIIGTLCFGLVCAAWLAVLITATGGVVGFWTWMTGQAAYFAAHDADLSRTGRSAAQIALRFVAHPWGPKWLAGPMLALAVLGAIDVIRRRLRIVVPVLVMSALYFAFALVMMDPADGVRYALPALPGVALLAAFGIEVLRRAVRREIAIELLLLALYGLGAYAYTGPLLRQRTSSPSPPWAAIQYLRSVAPRNAVILYDLPLMPHAQYLLRGYTRVRVDQGLARYGHRFDIPLYELTDSATHSPRGRVFRWETPDAYTKLTRGHYGAVSVVPVPLARRFQATAGISPPERARTRSWRWVGGRGTIVLPDLGARAVRLTFEVPDDYPIPANGVRVEVAGGASAIATVRPGTRTTLELPLPPGRAELTIIPQRTFVPANVPGRLSRDRRTLSVMLTGVEQVFAGEAAGRAAVR
jgi:hypothetical protein